MRASVGAVWLGLGVLFAAGAAAADPGASDAQTPDLELLEYLGGLVDEADRWVGPDDMQGALDAGGPEMLPDDGAATAEVVR
jgi:hypothetical protein